MSITREAIEKIVVSNNKTEALNVLRKNITPNYKIRSDLWRHEIFLNLIYDQISHCLKKGFSLDQCLLCSHFFENLLNLIRKSSSKLPSLVDHILENMKKLSPKLCDKSLQQFIDYLNLTILTHFNLYKYVFSFDKDDNTLVVRNPFPCPRNQTPEDVKLVKHYDTWLYEQKIKLFEEKQVEIKKKFENQRHELLAEEENALKLIEFINNDAYGAQKPLDEENMKILINQTSIPVFNIAKKVLKCEMDEIKENFNNNKQKQQYVNEEIEAQKAKQPSSITPKGKKK